MPTLICFHGSGTNHLHHREGLLESLSQQYRTVFFDRGTQNPPPEDHIKVLWDYLVRHDLKGPYILVAHSYGGLFAKYFSHEHHGNVGGMVLAETGKGGTSDHAQATLIRKGRLSSIPLSVVRANSFLGQWQALEANMKSNCTDIDSPMILEKKDWLRRCGEEDKKLEEEQLKLSRCSRLVTLPDCGHNVVLERPDVVLQEVEWVVEQSCSRSAPVSRLLPVKRLFSTAKAN